uniref:Cell cycle checkpoint protein RAD1 n=1 Tax=Crypthecodinium cohnii TaxID=2866 RepID=A0A516AGI3_CRYCO|nr:cell cycle checkpoint protein RAD1 [Crypthecodinium cohnii]
MLDPHGSMAGSVASATLPPGARFRCFLKSARDLTSLLALLHKDKAKRRNIRCEVRPQGLKFSSQSSAKDVMVVAWLRTSTPITFIGSTEEEFSLPLDPLFQCLQIFSERASILMTYPSGDSNCLHLLMEEDGARTECTVQTVHSEEASSDFSAIGLGLEEPKSQLLPDPASWRRALAEFHERKLDGATLQMTLKAPPPTAPPPSSGFANPSAVVFESTMLSNQVQVELPFRAFKEGFKLAAPVVDVGQVSHSYYLTSVLDSCMKAAKVVSSC